jgi:hypothetical protein
MTDDIITLQRKYERACEQADVMRREFETVRMCVNRIKDDGDPVPPDLQRAYEALSIRFADAINRQVERAQQVDVAKQRLRWTAVRA